MKYDYRSFVEITISAKNISPGWTSIDWSNERDEKQEYHRWIYTGWSE